MPRRVRPIRATEGSPGRDVSPAPFVQQAPLSTAAGPYFAGPPPLSFP